ncbi:MAG: GTPase HflX [Phycisphaerae bacterium]|jgi:GTP-binding protein HflX|nr:GTPase HflX [Phycisphaerae bacterium]
MEELNRNDMTVQTEAALLVAVILPGSANDPRDPLGELRALVRAAGGDIVDEMLAKRRQINPGYYVGSGKAKEIARRAKANEVDVVIFDNDLTPGQIRDLEEVIERKVIDRSELILDIFAAHARTNESRIQVELAQLEYTYPRLRHMWTHLSRIAGGAASSAGGIGTRGPGEKQIETDRRLVQKRISFLKRKITAIDKRKVRQIASRSKVFCTALVGYTNAGKSTLMRLLTGADIYVADQLFATLDTKTRRWNVDGAQRVLLSDSVGFIRDLPHHLVASFRATLEEAIHADLLIHVADASHPRVEHQIAAVDKVLEELDCHPKQQLLLLNKIDCINDPTIMTVLRQKYPKALELSALTGQGAEELARVVSEISRGDTIRVLLHANCGNGRLMQYIAQYAQVEQQTYTDSTAEIIAVMPTDRIERLSTFGDDIAVTAC